MEHFSAMKWEQCKQLPIDTSKLGEVDDFTAGEKNGCLYNYNDNDNYIYDTGDLYGRLNLILVWDIARAIL